MAKNLPGGYTLLPSPAYFTAVADPVAVFDPSVDTVANFRQHYGNTIDTHAEMERFLRGADGRAQPPANKTNIPGVLNTDMIVEAKGTHARIDAYTFPSHIELYQIAGWGITTLKGIQYTSKRDCAFEALNLFCKNILEQKPINTHDGDRTVVYPSAHYGTAKKYFLNINEINKDKKTGFEHKNILEAKPIIELVSNLLNSNEELPNYIYSNKPQNSDFVSLSVHSPVSISIMDTEGNHSGIMATGTELPIVEEQIPNSSYFEFGEGKYIYVPKEGNYTVTIKGQDFGIFTFLKEYYINDVLQQGDTVAMVDMITTPSMVAEVRVTNGVVDTMSIDINGNGTIDSVVNANQVFNPLDYLAMMKKTIASLNIPEKASKDMLKKIEKAEKEINSGKIKQAVDKIRALSKKVTLNKGHKKQLDTQEQQIVLMMFNQFLDNLK